MSDSLTPALGLPLPARARSVWRHRDLRVTAVAKALSFLGDEIAVVTLTLHAYDAGSGTRGVAALLVASALPLAAGAGLAGRAVDRWSSRLLTAGTSLWQGLGALGLVGVLALGDGRGAWSLVLSLALVCWIGVGQAVAGPAWQALVPHVVDDDEVTRAVSAIQATSMLAAVAGPAVGGLLVARGGVARALLLDAATFAVLAVAALAVRTVRRPDDDGTAGEGAWSGLAALRSDPLVTALVAGLVGVVVALQAVVVVQVFMVRGVLGGGPAAYGVVNGVFAASLVVGAVSAGLLRTHGRQAWAAVAGVAVTAAGAVLGGLVPGLVWLGVALGVVGVAVGVVHVCLHALVLSRTPDAARGRVVAVVTGLVQAGTVAGQAVGAVAGGLAGPRTIYVVAGCAALAVCVPVAVAVRRALRPEPVRGA